MANYKIPQKTSPEAKIVGPLTVRGLLIAVVFAGIAYAIYMYGNSVPGLSLVIRFWEIELLITAGLIALLGTALIFIKPHERYLEDWSVDVIAFFQTPKLRIWNKEVPTVLFSIPSDDDKNQEAPKVEQAPTVRDTASDIERIAKLSSLLDNPEKALLASSSDAIGGASDQRDLAAAKGKLDQALQSPATPTSPPAPLTQAPLPQAAVPQNLLSTPTLTPTTQTPTPTPTPQPSAPSIPESTVSTPPDPGSSASTDPAAFSSDGGETAVFARQESGVKGAVSSFFRSMGGMFSSSSGKKKKEAVAIEFSTSGKSKSKEKKPADSLENNPAPVQTSSIGPTTAASPEELLAELQKMQSKGQLQASGNAPSAQGSAPAAPTIAPIAPTSGQAPIITQGN